MFVYVVIAFYGTETEIAYAGIFQDEAEAAGLEMIEKYQGEVTIGVEKWKDGVQVYTELFV